MTLEQETAMQTIAIVLNVAKDKAAEFERGFRAQELPIWKDLSERGLLVMATLSRLDISTVKTEGAVQFLIAVVFATDEGHHVHDSDPRFEAWNQQADAYQIADPHVYGGNTIISVGPASR